VAKQPRAFLSVTGTLHTALERWCAAHSDVPISAVVEIVTARAIGMPLDELPEAVRRYVHLVPERLRS
jgi:hypothetical protein